MNCLMDNDVVLKLASIQLLEDWKSIAVKKGDEVRVLSTAKYFFGGKKIALRYGEAGVQSAKTFANETKPICEEDNPQDFQTLSSLPGIDAGEAVLFSSAVKLTDYMVVSGDKVALKSLQEGKSCVQICQALKGRVIAFEQVLLALIRCGNFSAIREKVVSGEKIDKVLQVAFSLGLETTSEKAIEALEGYIAVLRAKTGSLLISDKALFELLSD